MCRKTSQSQYFQVLKYPWLVRLYDRHIRGGVKYPKPGCERDGLCGVNRLCGRIDKDGRGTCGFCGGSIVASKYVITAAHCTAEYLGWRPSIKYYSNFSRILRADEIAVRVGDTNLNSTADDSLHGREVARFINVARIHRHAEWLKDPERRWSEDAQLEELRYDIAILELEEEIDLNILTPACLPKRNSFAKFDGKLANVVGWGVTKEEPTFGSGKAEYPETPQEVKLLVQRYNSSLHDSIIHARNEAHGDRDVGDCHVSFDILYCKKCRSKVII